MQKIRCVSLLLVMILAFSACGMESAETDNVENQTIHESSEETIYEDDLVYCVEKYEYWSDPSAPHPMIEMEHHTYDKKTDKELSLLDVTGMTSEEAADEIRKQLKEKYPEIYENFWGDKDAMFGLYYEYYNSIEPASLDFCLREDGIDVYDTWMLDHATNPYGRAVYVTLHK